MRATRHRYFDELALYAPEGRASLLPKSRDRFAYVGRREALLDVDELVAQCCIERCVKAAHEQALRQCLCDWRARGQLRRIRAHTISKARSRQDLRSEADAVGLG